MWGSHPDCDACGAEFKQKKYKWELNRKTVWLCPSCNSQMEKQLSKKAFDPTFELTLPSIQQRVSRGSAAPKTGCVGGLLVVVAGAIGVVVICAGGISLVESFRANTNPPPPAPATESAPKRNAPNLHQVITTTAQPFHVPETQASDERRESAAASKLRLARRHIDSGRPNTAKDWLKEIVRDYPETKAGKEAQKLLESP